MNQRVSSAHRAELNRKIWEMVDSGGWQHVCNFGTFILLAKGEYRRLIEPVTGQIQMQYIVNYEYEKGNTDAGL